MSISLELDREVAEYFAAPSRKSQAYAVRDPNRVAQMILMRESGAKLEEIGESFGITRERARQLLKLQGHVQKGRPIAVDAIAVLRAARAPGMMSYRSIPAAAGIPSAAAQRVLRELGATAAIKRLYRLRRRRDAVRRIQAWVEAHGHVPFSGDFGQGQHPKQDRALPHGTLLAELFGSIRAAIIAAGFVPRSTGNPGFRKPRKNKGCA